MVEYVDSSYAGDLEDRKSITGYCFFFGGAIVTWYSKQQRIVLISISKVKYVAMNQEAKEEVWIRQLLNELLPESIVRKIKILGDNEMSLTLTKDSKSQNCTKHINVIHYHIQELVENRKLAIE